MGKVVKEGDDLMSATRYAIMMLRRASTKAATISGARSNIRRSAGAEFHHVIIPTNSGSIDAAPYSRALSQPALPLSTDNDRDGSFATDYDQLSSEIALRFLS